MKAYGYSSKVPINEGPLPLNEISFWGQPEVLRILAKFMDSMANEIQCNPNFDHRRLSETWGKWVEDYPDIVIVKPD